MKKLFFLIFLVIFTSNIQAKFITKVLVLQKLASGHMVADVKIKGITSKFIIDTGSTSSVIDEALVSKLALKPVESDTKVMGYAPGKVEYSMSQYEVHDVLVEGFLTTKVVFVEQNIASAFAGLTESPIGGILGQEVLAAHGLLLDIKASSLSLPDTNFIKGYTVVPIYISEIGLPIIELIINKKSVHMIIDSGASEVMLDQKVATAENFGVVTYPEGMVGYDETGVERQIGLIEKGHILLGDKSMRRQLLVDDFSNILNQVNASRNIKVVGLIGLNALTELSAIIDIKNRKLYIK